MPLVDIYLIGGFLGSGKTTLLQNILGWDIDLSSTVVLLNEFGQISIDGMLLDSKGSEIVELANGCICCSMRGEFIDSIETVLNKFSPKMVFVETTGVADTLEVVAFLRGSMIVDKIVLKKVICVLDAELWEGKDNFGSVFFNQIKAADVVLVNKMDLVDKEKMPLMLREVSSVNPQSMVIPTFHSKIDPEVLLGAGSSFWVEEENRVLESEGREAAELEFESFIFQEEGALSETSFRGFLERLPFNVFRVKGPVKFGKNAFMLNHVGGRSHWIEHESIGDTRLVFIGWNLDIDALLRELKSCIDR